MNSRRIVVLTSMRMISVSKLKICNINKKLVYIYNFYILFLLLDENITDDNTYIDLVPVEPEFYNSNDTFVQHNVEQLNGKLFNHFY